MESLPIGMVAEKDEPKVTVRIIGRCNFHCPLCCTFSSPRRKGILKFADFQRIVDLLEVNKFCGVLNISGGETTLHPDLAAIVSYAAVRLLKARVVVFTNGDWVGEGDWRGRLAGLLQHSNVLLRFSIDRQHAEGKASVLSAFSESGVFDSIEKERIAKARLFLEACIGRKAVPGVHFDFAFKGTREEAASYLAPLGDVPIYPIQFQRDPSNRPTEMGFMAVDLDANERASVYLTLGHIPKGEALGGIETLPEALKKNREALRPKDRK